MVQARVFAALLALGAAAPSWGAVECDLPPFTAEDPQADAQLGCSAFLRGDAFFLGGHRDDSAGPDAGAVTPFQRGPGGRWVREPELTASDAGADAGEGAQFGFSVSADGGWLAVGAPLADSGQGVDTGAVYLFQRVEGRWIERQKLAPAGGARGGRFGQAVSMSGDTLLAGAPFDDDAGSLSGSVFVFERSEETWSLRQKLAATDAAPFDNFGFSVALDGGTAVVGAPFHDSRAAGGNSGAAYVFERTAGSWRQSTRLAADDGAAEDQFGSAVSILGATLAVGALGDDAGGLRDTGSVSVFERGEGGWTRTARLSGEGAGDQLGVSVSLIQNRLLAGARFHSAGGSEAGAAYLFARGTDGGWELEEKLPLPATAGDRFGHSLSAGGNNLLIGAYLDDPGSVVDAGSGTLCRIGSGGDETVVSIEKTDRVSEVVPGQAVTYTITVSHVSGPGAEVRVTDAFGPKLQGISWCPPDAGAGCASPRGGDIDEIIFLAPKGKAVFTVTAAVATNASGDLVNRACAFVAGEEVCARDVDRLRRQGGVVDLEVIKTADGPVEAGGLLTYTLTVTNQGTKTANGIVLLDPLPGEELVNLEPVSASHAGCTRTTDGFSCALGSLAAGASRSIRLTFRVLDTCAEEVRNGTMVRADEPDGDPEDNSISVTIPIPPGPPGLVFEKTGPDSTFPGGTVTYTLRVENPGPHRACGVLLEDPIPAGLTSPAVPPGCTVGEGAILCPVGDLPAGDARAFELDFTVLPDTCGSRIVNTARLIAEGADPQAGTKETEIVCGPPPPSGVSLVCADIDGSTLEGDAITYTFLLENHGPADQADNPGDEFSDLLPPGLTFVSAAATSGTITPGNPVLWNGAIPAGDTVTITITATIDAGTAGSTICNPATIAFDADGNGTNESSASSDAPCCFRVLTPEEIPALDRPGLILLALLVALAALRTVRKRGAIFRYK